MKLIFINISLIVPFTIEGSVVPTRGGCPIAQSPRQLKVRFLFFAPDNEVKILKKS